MSDRCHSQLMLCHMIASRQLLPSCRVKTVQGRWAEQKPEAVTSQHFSAKRNNGHFAHVRQPVMSLGCYRRLELFNCDNYIAL